MEPSNKFAQRFIFFSQHTTFHGFREVAESRRWFQKLIWIAIMIGSVAMLAYSLRKQVNQYLSDPMMTRISQLSKDEPYKYPEVWIGLYDWMWMDMEKIDRFNLSYEEIQNTKAFFNQNITLDSNKNIADIESSLNESMVRMDASGLGRFFSLLAYEKFDDDFSKWRMHLKGLGPNGYYYYCMDLSWAVQQNYSQTFSAALKFDFARYYENARRLSIFFKNQTIAQSNSAGNTSDGSDWSSNKWMNPLFANLEMNQGVKLDPGFNLMITIDSKIYRRLRDCRRGKDVEDDRLYYKHVCEVDCELRTNTTFGQSCIEFGQTTPDMGVYVSRSFRDGTVNACHRGLLVNGSLIGGEKPAWKGEFKEHERVEALLQCREGCLPECERMSTVWAILISPQSETGPDKSRPAPRSEITIDFPDRSTLIIFEEVLQYDWNDMVSDLGGLLGLWLGASMMSLFQVVHLCF